MLSLDNNNPKEYKLAIVIPCFNEEKRINLDAFRQQISLSKYYLFCFVDDGSTDDTPSILCSLKNQFPDQVLVIKNNNNLGKAEAVRAGFNFLTQYDVDYISYWDADQSVPFDEITRLFNIISTNELLLLVFGSRVSLFGSNIKRATYRHYLGRFLAGVIRHILNLHIYDTQCGIKIFHHSLADLVFKNSFTSRWLFDVEIFERIKSNYNGIDLCTIMKEVPLNEWKEVKGSKITVLDSLKIPFLLIVFAINMKYYRKTMISAKRSPKIEIANF